MTRPDDEFVEPWNHNIAYFPFIEKVAKTRPRRSALDVGTGDGMLAARLAASIPVVVGLDLHREQVVGAAATYPDHAGLRFEVGDVLTARVPGEPFDFVACSATIHHVDLPAGLARARSPETRSAGHMERSARGGLGHPAGCGVSAPTLLALLRGLGKARRLDISTDTSP